jgi:chemotaxis protein methyltransferase CheR
MNDTQFRQLLDHFGLSWQGYRKVRKGVIKRLMRHMRQLNVHDVDDYLARITSSLDIRMETRRLMTVSISRFFRDRPLWKIIKEKLLPEILSRHPERVNVWSAGCALGQEVYSFQMLWLFLEGAKGPLPPLSFIATDINQKYLDLAISGIYDEHAIKEVPRDCLERFFRYDQGRYMIAEALKQNISWHLHDLTDAPPMNGPFQMIFLRNNLLTYCKEEFHEGPISRFTELLTPGGYLIIGAREHIPFDDQKLIKIDDYAGIFQKR